MMTLDNKINNYVLRVIIVENNTNFVDDSVLDDIENCIYDKYGRDNSYTNELVIDHLERHRKNIKPKIVLNDEQTDKIVSYLQYVLNEEKHELHALMKPVVEENIINTAFGDDTRALLYAAGLIKIVVSYSHILNLVQQDEDKNLRKSRANRKIKTAIDLLMEYSTDAQVIHSLNSILLPQKTISYEVVLRSLFHNLVIVFQQLNFNLKDSSSHSHNILWNVFGIKEQYRITPKTKTTNYKGFILTQYTH